MHIGLSHHITGLINHSIAVGGPSILDTLGDRPGFAIDFVRREMRINDPATPANAYHGAPEPKLTKFGADPYVWDPQKGLELDAARDFSIALDTTVFPYEPAACTVYVAYYANAATSSEQRYLFMADNAGNDRFATYAVAGEGFRFVTGDGTSADISLSSVTPAPGVRQHAIFGADAGGKTFADDAGLQDSSAETLAASTPAYVGIGGYNNQVLRVLDGHIAEIMVVCEPVAVSLRSSIDVSAWTAPAATPAVFDILGPRNGFAIDFIHRQMRINDDVTPANTFSGDPEVKLTKFGADGYAYDPVKGLEISAGRDFSVALDTGLFPFRTDACSVYIKYFLNSASSTEQRYLFMTDNAGNDRFAAYAVSGEAFRFVTGDGGSADISLSGQAPTADVARQVTFGADADGKSYVDGAGIQADSVVTLASSTPAHVGIGGYNDRVLRVLDGHIAEIVVICEPVMRAARLTETGLKTIYKAEGDSHTFNTSYGLLASDFYPARVAAVMGAGAVSGNFGWSGDSSAEMVSEIATFLADSRPDIATLYCGANDGPVSVLASPAPTASVFTVDVSTRLAVDGWVRINGEVTQITGKVGDEITVSPALSSAPAANDDVEVDTGRNIEFWIDAMQAKGISKIMVIGYHYMNWATGGDTPTTEHPTRAALRAVQAAAAAAKGVPYCDTFAHMRAAVIAGDVIEGDDLAWHVGVGNTHLNAVGEQAVANAVYDAFVAEGWSG